MEPYQFHMIIGYLAFIIAAIYSVKGYTAPSIIFNVCGIISLCGGLFFQIMK